MSDSTYNFALSLDPDTLEPVVLLVVNDAAHDEPVTILLGDEDEAYDIAQSIVATTLQAHMLKHEIEDAGAEDYEDAFEVVKQFGQRVNASFN